MGMLLLIAVTAAAAATEARPCCFVNEAYAGVCRVVPANDESCAGILAYLNTPNSAGKTYCNATRIRGGWRETVCPPRPEPAAARAPTCPRPAAVASPGGPRPDH